MSVFYVSSLDMREGSVNKFWDEKCLSLHNSVWLPSTSNGQSNFVTLSVDHITKKQAPLTPSSIPVLIDEGVFINKPVKDTKAVATKKIRIYPEDEERYEQAISLYRRSYNLAVERYKEGTYKDEKGKWKDLRPEIKQVTKAECQKDGRVYHSMIVATAVLAAQQTFKAVCRGNNKRKTTLGEIQFKSRKSNRQSFSMDRLPKCLSPTVRNLGKIYITEDVPKEAVGKSFTVTRERGRWYICVQKHISLEADIQGQVRCVAIDPGVRTFATCYSDDGVTIFGENFAKERLFPLMKEVDRLLGLRQKVLNNSPKEGAQWVEDRLVNLNKRIDKLKAKKDDLVLDMHNRAASYLVSHYDVIFLPSFETSRMVSKKGLKRKMRADTCRQMLSLCHYQFKLRLKWYAKKYGKYVVDCNEAYTSKTRSWDGVIDVSLGSSKVIKGEGFTVDRDTNGARNIFIKCLTRGISNLKS